MTFDPKLHVPLDVERAAAKVAAHFEDYGVHDWRVHGCASRKVLEQAEEALAVAERQRDVAIQQGLRTQAMLETLSAQLAGLQAQRDLLLTVLEPFAKAHREWNGGNAPLHFSTAVVPAHFWEADKAVAVVKGGEA